MTTKFAEFSEARILGSREVIFVLNETEKGFDDVFVKYTGQEYYSRSFPNSYEEMMPDRFRHMEEVLKSELSKKINRRN